MTLKYILIITLLTSYIHAQLPDNIDLEADNIKYKKKSHLLQATSNVVIRYESLNAYSENFLFNTKNSEITFPTPLTLKNETQTATAASLHYNFKLNKGYATNIEIKANTLIINSKKMKISPLKTILYNTTLSNCNKEKKHMYISSKTIDIYPLVGIVNAKNNWIHMQFLPIKIPIPFIPYGTKTQSLLGKNPYFPELGENNIMGKYAIYKSSYIINKHLSGTTDIGYTENLNWILGGSNVLYKSKYFSQAIRYHYYTVLKTTAHYSITKLSIIKTKTISTNKSLIDTLTKPFLYQGSLPNSEINFITQKNGIIYDYWVDYIPKIEISIPQLTLFNTNIKTTVSVSQTTENTPNKPSLKKTHSHINNLFQNTFPISKKVTLNPKLKTTINQYNSSHKWHQAFFITTLQLKTSLNPEISYLQKLINTGKSPFLHEQQFALINNEIGFKINHNNKKVNLSYESFFTLQSQKFRQQNLNLLYKFHCWGLGFKWKITEKSLAFQFSLN